MKPILALSALSLVLCTAACLGAQEPPPPIDAPPQEEAPPPVDEPPLEDEPEDEPPSEGGGPAAEGPDPKAKPSQEGDGKRKAQIEVRVRPQPKAGAASKARINVDVEGTHIAEVMGAISEEVGVAIMTAPGIDEQITVYLKEIPWREAVEVIAKMSRCEVSEAWPGVLRLDQPAKITTVLEAVPLRVAVEQIAEGAGLDFVIGPGVRGRVSLDLKEVEGSQALRLAARSAGVSITIEDGLALITRAPLTPLPGPGAPRPSAGPYLDLVVEEGHLDEVALKLAKEAGLRLIPDLEQGEPFSLSLRGVDSRGALEALAATAGARIEELPGGVLRLARVPQRSRPTTLVDASLGEALAFLAESAELSVALDPRLSGQVTISVGGSSRAALYGLARAAGLSVRQDAWGVLWLGPAGGSGASLAPLRSSTQPSGKLLDLSFERVDLADAMEQIGERAQRNILVDPNVAEKVSCHLSQVDWRLAVDAIAASLDCEVENRAGILLLTQAPRNRVVAKAAPVGPLLQGLAKAAGVNLVLTPSVQGSLDLNLRRVPWRHLLTVAAEVAGCKLIESEGEVLVAVRDRALPKPSADPAEEAYQREIARLVAELEAAALARDLHALEVASRALRGAVRGPPPAQEVVTEPPLSEAERDRLDATLSKLRRKIEGTIGSRDVERMSRLMRDLRAELVSAHALSLAWEVFERRLRGDPGDVGLSIRLMIQIAEGNLLLKRMEEAIAAERYPAALLTFEKIKELKDRMLRQERDVFRRNAEALLFRGKALVERAERLLEIEERFRGLRVQATFLSSPHNERLSSFALINGTLVQFGERKPGLPRLLRVEPGWVVLAHEGTEFGRSVR